MLLRLCVFLSQRCSRRSPALALEQTMLILNADEVRQALPMDQAIHAMEEAYASLSAGTAVVPLRTCLPISNYSALSLFMPAYMKTESAEALAVKIVSLFPE